MKGILPPELKSVEQLFTADARYAVPPYQRSFAWGQDEIEELWEDISSAVTRSKKKQGEWYDLNSKDVEAFKKRRTFIFNEFFPEEL